MRQQMGQRALRRCGCFHLQLPSVASLPLPGLSHGLPTPQGRPEKPKGHRYLEKRLHILFEGTEHGWLADGVAFSRVATGNISLFVRTHGTHGRALFL